MISNYNISFVFISAPISVRKSTIPEGIPAPVDVELNIDELKDKRKSNPNRNTLNNNKYTLHLG